MSNFKSLEVSPNEYVNIKQTQRENGSNFREHIFGSRKYLYVHEKPIASCIINANLDLGDLSPLQFASFIANFNKHLYDRLAQNPDLTKIKIQFNGNSRDKNITLWNSLKVDTFFYNIDLKSAYWQIAHRLGYINTSFFNSYQELDSYKEAKRYCISFLARENRMDFSNGQSISCDIRPLQRIYDNIRYELYNCIQKSLNGVSDWIEYNIDGVSILAKDIPQVKAAFREMGLQFKLNECIKISDSHYSYKGNIKKFIHNNTEITL